MQLFRSIAKVRNQTPLWIAALALVAVVFCIAGCKANQTSADAFFNGRYNGAFTYALVKVMRATKNKLARKDVIVRMRALMKGKFAQDPQLEGNATNRTQAIIY